MTWRKAFLVGALFGAGVTTVALWEASDAVSTTGDGISATSDDISATRIGSPTLSVWAFVLLTPGQFVTMFVYDVTGSDAQELGIATMFLCQILLWSVLAVVILAMCRSGGCCRDAHS